MAKRFYKYFPWLFTFGDFIVIVISLVVSKIIVSHFIDVAPSNSFLYLTILAAWLLVTATRKDYKLGRTSDYLYTLNKLIGSLFWFLSILSLLWFLFHFQNYQVNRLFLPVSVSSMFILLEIDGIARYIVDRVERFAVGNDAMAVLSG